MKPRCVAVVLALILSIGLLGVIVGAGVGSGGLRFARAEDAGVGQSGGSASDSTGSGTVPQTGNQASTQQSAQSSAQSNAQPSAPAGQLGGTQPSMNPAQAGLPVSSEEKPKSNDSLAAKSDVNGEPERPVSAEQADLPEDQPHEGYRAGLWRDGKAVFSDIPLFDIFLKDYYRPGYRPRQPINYSHQIHVEKNGMECQYCHSGVTKSPYATLPSVELCMGCHKSVKTDSPEIKKLKEEFFDKKKPVPWVRVNNLPEHAHFNHKRHLKAGVGCQQCHGQVQKMPVVEKVASFKMGFCVSCHRQNGASIDCSICHY